MALEDIAIIIAVIGSAFAGLMWVIDHRVGRILHEIRPNGGASMRDAVDRIERAQERIEGKIDGHIEWHLEDK